MGEEKGEEGDKCRLPGRNALEETIALILRMRVIAVVGCSPKPERAGHYVAAYLKEQGYRIIPVNPGHERLLGEKCYPELSAIPGPVDVVNVFRNPIHVPPIIEEAIKIGAKALWLQDGVTCPEGEARARKAGLLVVSDDCLLRRRRAWSGG
jgi:predicted CoA-binding protein